MKIGIVTRARNGTAHVIARIGQAGRPIRSRGTRMIRSKEAVHREIRPTGLPPGDEEWMTDWGAMIDWRGSRVSVH